MSSNIPTGNGIGGVLFVVFLVLKLCHVINWSWWWVTAPLWGSFVIVVAVMIFTLITVFMIGMCKK
jgi:hypothetical protein